MNTLKTIKFIQKHIIANLNSSKKHLSAKGNEHNSFGFLLKILLFVENPTYSKIILNIKVHLT